MSKRKKLKTKAELAAELRGIDGLTVKQAKSLPKEQYEKLLNTVIVKQYTATSEIIQDAKQ